MMISTFEALTLLPPNGEAFIAVEKYGEGTRRVTFDLDAISDLAAKHYTATLGVSKRYGRAQLGVLIGRFWFRLTVERVNRMLEPYGFELATPLEASDTEGW